jgi:isoleucyl-tRNA synthetase
VRGEEQRFADSGVRDMTRRALLPWYNAFSFLKTYAEIDSWSPDKGLYRGDNILDHWIVSRMQTLKANVNEQMEAYRLYNVVPQLFDFIEDLTNWYIRLNRSRFWGEDITADKIAAYSTLYTTLYELSQVMAPFAPFLAEKLYLELSALGGGVAKPESVHLCDYPEPEPELIEKELETAVDRMQQVVLLGRQKREEVRIGLRTPLRCLTIVHRDRELLADIARLEQYVKQELNVLEVRYDSDEGRYITLAARPNFPLLGKRLGKRMKEFQQLINSLTPEQIADLQQAGEIALNSEVFTLEEIEVQQQASAGTGTLSNRYIAVDLDCELDDELIRGGYAREITRVLQQQRKDQGLHVADRIAVRYSTDGELARAVQENREFIMSSTLCTDFESVASAELGPMAKTVDIDGHALRFSLQRVEPSA